VQTPDRRDLIGANVQPAFNPSGDWPPRSDRKKWEERLATCRRLANTYLDDQIKQRLDQLIHDLERDLRGRQKLSRSSERMKKRSDREI
jgi:hypothetical protein